jgi:hypothetical protein
MLLCLLCKTVILEVFYKAAVITLPEITFWRNVYVTLGKAQHLNHENEVL